MIVERWRRRTLHLWTCWSGSTRYVYQWPSPIPVRKHYITAFFAYNVCLSYEASQLYITRTVTIAKYTLIVHHLQYITHADDNRGSKAYIGVCASVCLSARYLKLNDPKSLQTWCKQQTITFGYPTSDMVFRSKGQRSNASIRGLGTSS